MNIHELKLKHPRQFDAEYYKWLAHEPSHCWWDTAYEEAKTDALPLGFRVDDIEFSGFYSQGDGAAWSGIVDIPKFIEVNNLQEKPDWFLLYELVRIGCVYRRMEIYTSGRMQMCSSGFADMCDDDYIVDSGVLMGATIGTLLEGVILWEMEGVMLDAAKDYASGIYNALMQEYDYLTSEESFVDYCEANEMDFLTEEGEA